MAVRKTLRFQALFLVASLPWLGLLWFHASHESFQWRFDSWARMCAQVFWNFLSGPVYHTEFMKWQRAISLMEKYPLFAWMAIVASGIFLAVIYRVVRDAAGKDLRAISLFCVIAFPIALVCLTGNSRLTNSRYFSFFFFAFSALVGHSLVQLSRIGRIACITALTLINLTGAAFILLYPADPVVRSDDAGFARYLSAHARRTDVVYCELENISFELSIQHLTCGATLIDNDTFEPDSLRDKDRAWIAANLMDNRSMRKTLWKAGFEHAGPMTPPNGENAFYLFVKKSSAGPSSLPQREALRPHGGKWGRLLMNEILPAT